jgi:hypothetical protein
VDVGEVRCGSPLAHRFLFVNRGQDSVEITDVKAACGCMTPTLDKKVLRAGEEGSLLLEVNTLSQASGPEDWWVRLAYHSEGQVHEITLRLVGRLITEIGVEPASMVIHADKEIQHVLIVTDTRPQPLAVKGVSATSPSLHTSVGMPLKNEDGLWTIPIQLRFDGQVPDGQHQDTICIVTGDPAYPELRVPVTIVKETASQVTIAPDSVEIHAQAGQPLPSKIVMLRTSGTVPIDVANLTADHPAIHCTYAPGPENNATLKVTIDRQRIQGDLFATLQIHLRSPSTETLVLPVKVISQ